MIKYNPLGVISTDLEAEEMILQIQAHDAERDRLVGICQAQIKKYQEQASAISDQYDTEASYPMLMLGQYAKQRERHITATKETYKLPSGSLVWKKPAPEFVRDNKALLGFVTNHAKRFIKTKTETSVDWENMKKQLIFTEDNVLEGIASDDGEIIPIDGLTIVERPEVFEVVTKGGE